MSSPPSPTPPAASPVKKAVHGLWEETQKLQKQITRNYDTTNDLLRRASTLRERIVRQRRENKEVIAALQQSTPLPTPTADGAGVTDGVQEAEGETTAQDAGQTGASPMRGPPRPGTADANGIPLDGGSSPAPGGDAGATSGAEVAAVAAEYAEALKERDGMIARLEQDNTALQETLEEFEGALEEMMGMHRSQVAAVQQQRAADVAALETQLEEERTHNVALATENVALQERIQQMTQVMLQAAQADEQAELDAQLREQQLLRKNQELERIVSMYDSSMGIVAPVTQAQTSA